MAIPTVHPRSVHPRSIALPMPGLFAAGRLQGGQTSASIPARGAARPKSELMAQLRTATDADEIIDVLSELGRARRGSADELTYLAEHPGPHVRDTLASVLRAYRGPEARRLRTRL